MPIYANSESVDGVDSFIFTELTRAARSVNLLVDESVLNERRQEPLPPLAPSQTPWQELYRQLVGQLSTGGCLEPATLYWRVIPENGPPRHSH